MSRARRALSGGRSTATSAPLSRARRAERDHRPEHGVRRDADREARAGAERVFLRDDHGLALAAARGRADHRGPRARQHPSVAQPLARGRRRTRVVRVGTQRHRIAQASRDGERFGQRIRRGRRRDRQRKRREQRVRLHARSARCAGRRPRRCAGAPPGRDPAGAARAAAAALPAATPDGGDTPPGTRTRRSRSPACRSWRRRRPRARRSPRRGRSRQAMPPARASASAARRRRRRAPRRSPPATGRGTCSTSTASTFGSESAASTAAAIRVGVASPRTLIGLRHAMCGGSIPASVFFVAAESSASMMPRSAALSAASVPGPWPLVTIASRSPRAIRFIARIRAAANNCV